MKSVMALIVSLVLPVFASAAVPGFCAKYTDNSKFITAIETVATRAQYSFDQLCTLERLSDIYAQSFMYVDPKGESIPHTWVTLHYNEYSCQYFIRDNDQSLTRSNCYSTF